MEKFRQLVKSDEFWWRVCVAVLVLYPLGWLVFLNWVFLGCLAGLVNQVSKVELFLLAVIAGLIVRNRRMNREMAKREKVYRRSLETVMGMPPVTMPEPTVQEATVRGAATLHLVWNGLPNEDAHQSIADNSDPQPPVTVEAAICGFLNRKKVDGVLTGDILEEDYSPPEVSDGTTVAGMVFIVTFPDTVQASGFAGAVGERFREYLSIIRWGKMSVVDGAAEQPAVRFIVKDKAQPFLGPIDWDKKAEVA